MRRKINHVKEMIAQRFNVRDLAQLKSFLRFQVKQEDDSFGSVSLDVQLEK